MTKAFASVAIGGTKCSVALAAVTNEGFDWVGRRRFATLDSPTDVLDTLVDHLVSLLKESDSIELSGIGVVCGGPLDEPLGLVLSPPNLSRWERVDALSPFRSRFGVPVRLMNDANAGVLAEWVWGAAQGADDAVFLTMGTGLGAGLIFGGRLYRGANGLAGEIGHWRLAESGPDAYGKGGSFESFCSGTGIAQWARQIIVSRRREGSSKDPIPDWFGLADVTALQLAQAADEGEPVSAQLWTDVGRRLGAGLALIVDLLNPDVIVLGGIFFLQRERLEKAMHDELKREALPELLSVCRIVPSDLGEQIDNYSGLVAALIGDDTTVAGRRLTVCVPPARVRDEPIAALDKVSTFTDSDSSVAKFDIKHSSKGGK